MRLLARASAGLWLWAMGFSLLYGLHGVGCAQRWDRIAMPGGTLFGWAMIGTWLALAGAAAAVALWARCAPRGLERRLALASALAGLVAILVTGAPVAAFSACL
ncbi:hypothetical protein ACG3SL_04330 [Sphingomonas sp. CJ20]